MTVVMANPMSWVRSMGIVLIHLLQEAVAGCWYASTCTAALATMKRIYLDHEFMNCA